MTPEERAAAIGAQFPANGIQYTYLGIVFAVSDCVVSGPAVSVVVSAWTGTGKNKAYLPVDDRYVFVNPPLMVPDGGTTTIPDPTDPGHVRTITVRTFTRSDLAAAQQIVYDAVTGYALAHGWVAP